MILRRRFPGLKPTTEATASFMMGRGAFFTGQKHDRKDMWTVKK
ncbi:hypothetical protein CLOHIR_02087 [Peptacetobacter hiranonis DSM 13275]|uniref:Uncharacterized protein n=1 Tax=Peptacetobacter hiranonis (strain DSM 13275 / JCM 10541 / KCTC 15199 / TO-931) TaxID=500633 RepID=B6G1S9_PEPHT|nr:hypothetical protein CLOHIR_02087 [Peptacetobacter hiranonis DSM 13275]